MAIIGAGAMGCLFCARLKTTGNDVLLVERDARTVSEIGRNGVRLRQLDGRVARVRVPVEMAPGNLQEFELVLITVKAYSTSEAARQHRRRVGREATILTLQNGLGNVEALARWFGGGRVVAGSTTEASLLLGPGVVAHTGRGRIVIGEMDGRRSDRCLDILNVFREAGFESGVTGNVEGVVWSKAIVNSAINPVSALTGLRNGWLDAVDGVRRVMLGVVDEGVRVSGAEGVRLEPGNTVRLLHRILRASAGNRSSMLQDVLNGRRTEIRELNGVIVERGRRNGIATPCNRFLTSLVVGLEQSSRKRAG